jgi:endonuclease VIII
MPEGPSLVILKEQVQSFKKKKIEEVSGNSKQDIQRLQGEKVIDFKSWGKHFLIECKSFSVKIHFMLFGSYSVNEKRDKPVRLGLRFKSGEINFYNCSVQFIEEPLDEVYDWSADVLNEHWDPKAARKKLKAIPEALVTDVLLDQNIFSGVGNIIKNEVLYRIRVHPESSVGALTPRKLTELIREARNYSFDFLEWKRQYVLRKHWLAHKKLICARDGSKITKEYLGKTNRRTFFCKTCQILYK